MAGITIESRVLPLVHIRCKHEEVRILVYSTSMLARQKGSESSKSIIWTHTTKTEREASSCNIKNDASIDLHVIPGHLFI